jgi:DNA repair protein RecO (recombination protein O)
MNWSDEGIILSVRPHGETAAIGDLLTRAHGRHVGLVYGGRSRRVRPVLQIGNYVDVTWKARLAEQLGHMRVELRKGYAASAMEDALALAGLASVCGLSRLLPERDPHPRLFEITLYVLGYGLDLSVCASTGAAEHLAYVSPRSGRAVSAIAGEPYKDRLLPLPAFLMGGASGEVTTSDIVAGLALTGHFLEARALRPRELEVPEARRRFAALVTSAKRT